MHQRTYSSQVGDGSTRAAGSPESGTPHPEQLPVDAAAPADLPAWTLVQTAHLAGRRFHELFASQGLTAHQFGILVALSRRPGLSQAALAREILVTPQSIGAILTQMDSTDLVRRTPPTQPGAAISVAITPRGQALLAQTFPLVGAMNTPAALGLDQAQARTLNELLHRVHDHLDDRAFAPLPDGV